jgi:hypothetical protein
MSFSRFWNKGSRLYKLSSFCVALAVSLIVPHTASAQPSKGFQIILTRGLQIQALCIDDCYVHQTTFSNANYTTMNFINGVDGSGNTTHSSRPSPEDPSLWMGAAPGPMWGRWAMTQTQMPPQITPYGGDEAPYMSQLVSLQLGDEWFLSDGPTRTNLINWFNSVQSNYPNVILYHNNYAGQADDASLADFIPKAKPDMLCFDLYPWNSVWLSNGVAGAAIPGPPTGFYSELRRYRQWGMASNIPIGAYRQTFHSIEDYDQRVYRDPSPSELRLNTFSALAFNAKVLIDFTYNTGASSLFTKIFNGAGDTQTNALYNEMIDVNLRAQNFGKALVRLAPILDMHNPNDVNPPPGPASTDPTFPDGITTSMYILRGKTLSGGTTNINPLPNSFQSDPQAPNSYSWWEYQINDPYLNGWSVTNKAGVKNNGLIGDVIISWFHPIDDGYSPTRYTNEIYFMVVNGLSDPTGTAADCMQEIKLNFTSGTNFTAIEMLDPVTGTVTTNVMPVISGSGTSTRRQLVLDIKGGDAVLFKYSDGVPFVTLPVAGKLSANVVGGQPTFTLKGPYAAKYRIEYSSSLTAGSWSTLTNVQVSAATGSVTFTDPAGSAARFYRAIALP